MNKRKNKDKIDDMQRSLQMLENILDWAKEYDVDEDHPLKVDKKLNTITFDKKWQPPTLQQEQRLLMNSVLWWNQEYEEIGYHYDQEKQTVTYGNTYIQITISGPTISFAIHKKSYA